jgi:hypothetical protein
MRMSTADAAERLGMSRRGASYAIRDAGFVEEVGNASFVDHLAVLMVERSRGEGRRWAAETALAAFDLLDRGTTDRLRHDSRSRLRSQLKTQDAAAIAHRAEGVLGRIRRVSAPRGTARIDAQAAVAAMSGLDEAGTLDLGIHGGLDGTRYLRTPGGESRQDLVRTGLVDDAGGDIVLLAGAIGPQSASRVLLECYLLGDTRMMRAAADALTSRARTL